MPDVAAWLVKGHLDAGDLVWQRRDHIFGRVLDVLHWLGNNLPWDDILQPESCPHLAIVLNDRLRDDIGRVVGSFSGQWEETA